MSAKDAVSAFIVFSGTLTVVSETAMRDMVPA